MQSIATMEPVWQCGPGRPTTTVRLLDACENQRGVVQLAATKTTYLFSLGSPCFRFLNCGRGRVEKGVKSRLYDRVAFARCLFEAEAIDDLHHPPVIADQAGRLHGLSGKGYRFTIGTQNM